MTENVIKVGEYIIIQKQNYKKLHKLNKSNSTVSLGKDSVNLSGIEGCPFFSVFRMIPNSKKGKEYRLELTEEALEFKDEIDIKTSGTDNRNILDDGRSQKLSAAEIAELANDGSKPSDIVETLISNSNTFHNKTEFSQQKYLKKKEKKYFGFIEILKPNLRLISEVMYRLDPGKIQNLRIDTLSQIISYSNIHSEGVHMLYDSGSNGLMSAALLSAIGANTNAKLIHIHPGNMSQKQALLAMNFPEEQLNRCISVNIYSVLRQYYQGCDTHMKVGGSEVNPLKRKTEDDSEHTIKLPKLDGEENINESTNQLIPEVSHTIQNTCVTVTELSQKLENGKGTEITQKSESTSETTAEATTKFENTNENKREEIKKSKDISETITKVTQKSENGEEFETYSNNNDKSLSEPKKPKWHYDNITASQLLAENVDSLVIVCKEDPSNILTELMQFVKPGRPFVIYYSVAEPLQKLLVELKSNPKVSVLKLTCNWMRNYQILPERTHPEVMMNNQSGFLLTGYILK